MCSWTCQCAKQVDDCDSKEEGWVVCRDVAAVRTSASSCDECRPMAVAECGAIPCPPDPATRKAPLTVRCNGREVAMGSAPPTPDHVAAALAVTPSVATKAPTPTKGQPQLGLPEELLLEVARAPGDVTCSFACSCSAERGACDAREGRIDICADKALSTKTGPNCMVCRIRANAFCGLQACPLVPRANKVVSQFTCPEE